MPRSVAKIQLAPETLKSFEKYVLEAEAAMEETLPDAQTFLWSDANPDRARKVRSGEVVAQFWAGSGPTKVPGGLIHDWVGAAFTPGTKIEAALALVQDYDHHQDIYRSGVLISKLMRHRGNDFEVYLRLLKKKVLTVVLDTDHDVQYRCIAPMRWLCRSYTTRIAEVENAGTPREEVSAPDTGYGFLWRLYSYWRFQERDGGVYTECRAISLSRDVPFGLGWIVEPIIQKLPRESLIETLISTRQALLARLT